MHHKPFVSWHTTTYFVFNTHAHNNDNIKHTMHVCQWYRAGIFTLAVDWGLVPGRRGPQQRVWHRRPIKPTSSGGANRKPAGRPPRGIMQG